jgi:hypothetical protein
MSGGWKFRFAGSGLSLFTEEGVVSEMIVLLRTRWRTDFFRKLHPRLSLEPLLWNEIYITSSNWCYIKTDFLFFPTFDCNSWWWMAYRNLIDIQAIRFDEMDISSKKYTYIHTYTCDAWSTLPIANCNHDPHNFLKPFMNSVIHIYRSYMYPSYFKLDQSKTKRQSCL